jgi:mannosylglycerate hydrolase
MTPAQDTPAQDISAQDTPAQDARATEPLDVDIVVHTHWDREWYLPFARFRVRLVELLDDVLHRLNRDRDTPPFLLDGQLAVVDDYLALRPEAEDTLRRLIAQGRVDCGPWYVLMDEFLVSAETIVRNLRAGLRRAGALGAAMEVGYLPDMFGHIAQMPQILRRAGFADAVVWRGVPAAVASRPFRWEAPDGSAVRAEHLPQGYGNGAATPADPTALEAQLRAFAADFPPTPGRPLLWMVGSDHMAPPPWLADVVRGLDRSRVRARFTTLPAHLASAGDEALPTWRGELRSGAVANLLPGVVSNRVDVRRAAAAAEHALERRAEPALALFGIDDSSSRLALADAWQQVLLNAAHDSICACSADDVVDAVLVRYADARHTAEAIGDRCVRDLAARMRERGPLLVSTTARDRSAVVELTVDDLTRQALVDSGHVVHVLETPAPRVLVVPSPAAPSVVERELDIDRTLGALHVGPGVTDDRIRFTLESVADEAQREPARAIVARVLTALADHHRRTTAEVVTPPTTGTRILTHASVPGFGWSMPGSCTPPAAVTSVTVEPGRPGPLLANGLLTLAVDGRDGTFGIDGATGLGRLVDEGDDGDTYNWSPVARDTVVDAPVAVRVTVAEDTPLRARVRIERDYRWPSRVQGARRVDPVDVTVVTVLELRAGEPFVRVEVSLDHRVRDHRLRMWLPLPEATRSSMAECAFGVVRRGLVAEGGPTEAPIATYPAKRFVQAGRVLVLNDAVSEYELVDIRRGAEAEPSARALAVTVLRATGWLSRGPMAARPLPAGPELALEGPQLDGRVVRRFAVHVAATADDLTPARAYELASLAWDEPLALDAPGGGDAEPTGRALVVHGAEVSAVVPAEDGAVEIRAFNPDDASATELTVTGGDGTALHGLETDLRGRTLSPFDGRRPMGAAEIVTVVVATP